MNNRCRQAFSPLAGLKKVQHLDLREYINFGSTLMTCATIKLEIKMLYTKLI